MVGGTGPCVSLLRTTVAQTSEKGQAGQGGTHVSPCSGFGGHILFAAGVILGGSPFLLGHELMPPTRQLAW